MADAQSMLTNHLFYKAISKRQSERPRPFPTRAELKWVNCVPTGLSKSCFARTNHRYFKNLCICYSSSNKTARFEIFELLWGYVLHNNNGKLKRTNPILIVSDLVFMCVSWIFLKCFLIRAILPFFPPLQPIPHCCKFFASSLTSYLVRHSLHFSNCFTGFQPQGPHGSNITQQKPIH